MFVILTQSMYTTKYGPAWSPEVPHSLIAHEEKKKLAILTKTKNSTFRVAKETFLSCHLDRQKNPKKV